MELAAKHPGDEWTLKSDPWAHELIKHHGERGFGLEGIADCTDSGPAQVLAFFVVEIMAAASAASAAVIAASIGYHYRFHRSRR